MVGSCLGVASGIIELLSSALYSEICSHGDKPDIFLGFT